MALKILQAFRLILQYCEAASLRSVVPAAAILAKHKRIERSSRLIKYFIHHCWYNNLEIVSGERFLLRGRPQRTCRSKMHKKQSSKQVTLLLLLLYVSVLCKGVKLILKSQFWFFSLSSYYVNENGVITYTYVVPLQCPKKITSFFPLQKSVCMHAYIHKLQITSFDRRITQFLICYVYVCF